MESKQDHLSAYAKNELNANKHMTFLLLFTAGLMVLVLLGYIFKLFDLSASTFRMTVIVISVLAVLICIPGFFLKTDLLTKPGYKYFILGLFVLTIGVLNVIMPKHGILGWAICIALTGHYYSPKVCRIMFWTVIFMMLVCLGLGMFYGEFDSNLLTGELNKDTEMIISYHLPDAYPDTPAGRWEYLRQLMLVGENRFFKAFFNYYIGRALFVTLIYAIIFFLNKRTHTLLQSEIEVNGEFEKNKTELEVAKDIQLNTLPSETLSSKDIEILAELKAAKEVGGDLYDYREIDENHVAVLIGDVSGKGVPAAMFMMKTLTSFRDFAKAGKKPSEILREINASIYEGNKTTMFVTCFLAIIDRRDGVVKFANAGHNPPVIGDNGHYRYLECSSGFLLGCFKQAMVKDEEVTLKPGESLILYTDGITEARDPSGLFFGEERLLESLNKRDFTSVIELHRSLKDDIAFFVKDAPQSDDITFLTLRYQGGHYSFKEKEFVADRENILTMLAMINDFGDEHNFPEDFKNKLVIVGDELISNIINHGYEGASGTIFLRLLFNETENEFILTVIDHAQPFNQLDVENPFIGTQKGLTKVGGLGIHIVKKIMTECSYDRINGKNILVLKKRF